MLFSSALVAASLALPTLATYTWPNPRIDELEHLLVDTGGPDNGGIKDAITPCTNYVMGTQILGRSTAAQWIRVAFHDSAPANVTAKTGGLDASIGFETLRAENSGSAMNDTLGFFANFTSAYVSNADLIALGVVQSVGSCGGPQIPLRAGRVDATGPGDFGTPEPETDIEETLARAKVSGYNQADFIALTACGHTMGATHHGGFPQVVPESAVTPTNTGGGINFDTTKGVFDIDVVNEYLTGTGQRGGPLVTTANVTVQSDLRLYVSDKNATMKTLASQGASAFANTCSNLFARMINTVPKGVQLTDPIVPNAVKPVNISLDLDQWGGLVFSGSIRLLSTTDLSTAKVVISWTDDYAFTFFDSYSVTAKYSASGTSNFGTTYYHSFSTSVPITGISSFTISVTPKGGRTTTYTNGGNGYPVQDTAIFLRSQSSVSDSGVATISVAVSEPIFFSIFAPNKVSAVFSVPVWQSGTISPKIQTVSSTLKYSKRAGLYSIYTSTTQLPKSYGQLVDRSSVAVSASWGKQVFTDDFNKLAGL